jgi:hypothetical protein
MKGAQVPSYKEEFHLQVFLESMGPGLEYNLPEPPEPPIGMKSVPAVKVGGEWIRSYTHDINIAANAVEPGTYKLVAFLQAYDRDGVTPLGIVGFIELPLVTFYKPA